MRKKKRSPSTSSKKGIVARYNERETKGKIGNSALKTLVDGIAGAVIGTGVGAMAGKYAAIIGPVIIGIGHYTGDKSGVIRIAGASAMAYGIAKALENQSVNGLGSLGDVKSRIGNLQEELFVAFYLDKVFKKKGSTVPSTSTSTDPDTEIAGIDLSALDMFEHFNEQEADAYQQFQGFSLPDYEDDLPSGKQDFSFAVIDDPDLSDF